MYWYYALGVYSGLRSKKQKTAEKQNSGEAEKQRSRKAKKQRSREAQKGRKTEKQRAKKQREKQRSRETEIQTKCQSGFLVLVDSLVVHRLAWLNQSLWPQIHFQTLPWLLLGILYNLVYLIKNVGYLLIHWWWYISCSLSSSCITLIPFCFLRYSNLKSNILVFQILQCFDESQSKRDSCCWGKYEQTIIIVESKLFVGYSCFASFVCLWVLCHCPGLSTSCRSFLQVHINSSPSSDYKFFNLVEVGFEFRSRQSPEAYLQSWASFDPFEFLSFDPFWILLDDGIPIQPGVRQGFPRAIAFILQMAHCKYFGPGLGIGVL